MFGFPIIKRKVGDNAPLYKTPSISGMATETPSISGMAT
jgi:hypothetical protein